MICQDNTFHAREARQTPCLVCCAAGLKTRVKSVPPFLMAGPSVVHDDPAVTNEEVTHASATSAASTSRPGHDHVSATAMAGCPTGHAQDHRAGRVLRDGACRDRADRRLV